MNTKKILFRLDFDYKKSEYVVDVILTHTLEMFKLDSGIDRICYVIKILLITSKGHTYQLETNKPFSYSKIKKVTMLDVI